MSLSYTSASDFQTCKARYFHKYIAKDAPFQMTPAMEYGDRVHKAFEARLGSGRHFPEELAHLEPFAQAVIGNQSTPALKLLVEQRLGIRADGTTCGFYDKDRFWNTKVDVALMNDQTCLLFDWKTGKQREDPWELAIQSVLMCATFPTLRTFKGRYVWLKNNAVGELHNLSDVKRTWAEMQSLGAMVQRSQETNYWPEQEGPLCAWCPVLKCRFNRNSASTVAAT